MKSFQLIKRFAFVGAMAGLFTLSACESSNTLLEGDAETTQLTAVQGVTDQFNLSQSQSDLIESAVQQTGTREPGALWHAAAELQKTLTADQKEEMLASVKAAVDQHREQRRERGEEMKQKKEALFGDLTDDQKEQLKALHEANKEKRKAVMEQVKAGELEKEEARKLMEENQAASREAMAEFLTAEQLERFDEAREARAERVKGERAKGGKGMRAFRKGKMKGARGQRGTGERVNGERSEKLAEFNEARIEALGLTETQVAELKAHRESQREEMKALMESIKAEGGDKAAIKEQMKVLHEKSKAAADDILTEEQQEIIAIHRALAYNLKKNRAGDGVKSGRRGQR